MGNKFKKGEWAGNGGRRTVLRGPALLEKFMKIAEKYKQEHGGTYANNDQSDGRTKGEPERFRIRTPN